MSEWQPIETAPKDGKYVLVWPGRCTGIACDIARWEDDKYAKSPRPFWARIGFSTKTGDRVNSPTHWQPLPPPPHGRAGGDTGDGR